MKIAAMSKNSPWADRALRDVTSAVTEVSDVQIAAAVDLDLAEILHHGADRNYRPYLRLSGSMTGFVPEEDVVYGITEVLYAEGSRPTFDAFMEFTDEELSELALKGIWNEGFEIPAMIRDADWRLPSTANLMVLAPRTMDEPPVVFVELLKQNMNEYDESQPGQEHGYGSLAPYFPNIEDEVEVEGPERTAAPITQRRIDDLFAGVEFEDAPISEREYDGFSPAERREHEAKLAEAEAADKAINTGLVPGGAFERLFLAHEAVQPTITADPEPEPEVELEGEEAVYAELVRPFVDEAMSKRPTSGDSIMGVPVAEPRIEVEAEASSVVREPIEEPDFVKAADPVFEPAVEEGSTVLKFDDEDVDLRPEDEVLPVRAPRPVAPPLPAELRPAEEEIDSRDEDLLEKEAEARAAAEREAGADFA